MNTPVIDLGVIVIRRGKPSGSHPFTAGVWCIRPDDAQLLSHQRSGKIARARWLAWSENACGNMWLTWIGGNGNA